MVFVGVRRGDEFFTSVGGERLVVAVPAFVENFGFTTAFWTVPFVFVLAVWTVPAVRCFSRSACEAFSKARLREMTS